MSLAYEPTMIYSKLQAHGHHNSHYNASSAERIEIRIGDGGHFIH